MKLADHALELPSTLGQKAFASISAVEGLVLTAESRQRLHTLEVAGLSFEERRQAVLRAYKGQRRSK
jgi:hypothetical protein